MAESRDDGLTPPVIVEHYFAPIPEALLYDDNISPQAIRIYGVLVRHGSTPADCYPSQERIGKLIGLAERSVRRPILELERAGWISRRRRFTKAGDRTSDGYTIHAQPRANMRDTNGQSSATSAQICADQRAETSEEREPVNESQREEPNPLSAGADVRAVFGAWVEATGRSGRTQLNDDRAGMIRRWLKRYPVADLVDAVRGWRWSPHHCGENDRGTVYNDLSHVLKNSRNIETFRDYERGIGRPRSQQGPRLSPSRQNSDAVYERIKAATRLQEDVRELGAG